MARYVTVCRLSVYLGNADVERHKSVSEQILRRAHRAGLRGATTWPGTACSSATRS